MFMFVPKIHIHTQISKYLPLAVETKFIDPFMERKTNAHKKIYSVVCTTHTHTYIYF